MESSIALAALSALAQETRLAIFRHLVARGPNGSAAGEIAALFQLPKATLSFHLKELKSAGLIACTRRGRSLIYAADFAAMNALLGYLTENCCRGELDRCLPSDGFCMP